MNSRELKEREVEFREAEREGVIEAVSRVSGHFLDMGDTMAAQAYRDEEYPWAQWGGWTEYLSMRKSAMEEMEKLLLPDTSTFIRQRRCLFPETTNDISDSAFRASSMLMKMLVRLFYEV